MKNFYKKLNDDEVQCLACVNQCKIKNDQVGICGVRQNKNGKLNLLVENRPIAINLDPIEKKPLFHFLPGTEIFSFGTFGCNFRCAFCQNWDISQLPKSNKIFEEFIKETTEFWPPEKIVNYCLENKISSIAYTYNEPTIFVEYALKTMILARKNGIKNVFVSNGYQSNETIKEITPYLDAINIDLKSMNEKFYQKICGAHLEPILKNIKTFYQKGVWIELTTLIIPQENDSEKELKEIAQFIAQIDKNIPWHISRFFPNYQMTDYKETSIETIKKAYEIGKKAGLNFVYGGNIINSSLENTFCPQCGALLIARNNYNIKITENFSKGRCLKCHAEIKGVWQ
jgi:pyruvate formate lyase activating enzyme